MDAIRHILALLVAVLWLVGSTPPSTQFTESPDERVSRAGDVEALPIRRIENPQILGPSTGADTKGNPPHLLDVPSAPVAAIKPGFGLSRRGYGARRLCSGLARGPPLWS